MKVAILLADGFEEIEAITPKDIIERSNIQCDFVSIMDRKNVIGTHNIEIIADKIFDENEINEYDMVVLPGGLDGAVRLSNDNRVLKVINDFYKNNKKIAAICAAPALVVSKTEVAKNKKMTCYPKMEEFFKDSIYVEDNVCVDENLITSRGPATAMEFAFRIVEELGKNCDELKSGMLFRK